MGQRKRKVPDCVCRICLKWNHEAETLNEYFAREATREGVPVDLRKFYSQVEAIKGCDLCGSEHVIGLLWIPEIIQTFFGQSRLCVHCRSFINWTRQAYEWPICWGSTSEDETKWFLVAVVYEKFKNHFDGRRGEFAMWHECCVEGVHARRAPVKPQPGDGRDKMNGSDKTSRIQFDWKRN